MDFNDIKDGALYEDPENYIAFDIPYIIGEEGIYVGYFLLWMLLVVTSLNPFTTEKNANFLSFSLGWEDLSGKEGM